MQLPKSVANLLHQLGGPSAVSQVVEAAMTRIMEATPQERFAMMQAALAHMREEPSEVTFEVPADASEEFDQYCQSKMLRAEVLLSGALLVELGRAELDPTDVPDRCQAHPAPRHGDL
jgi:hypothetical protein